MNPVDDFDLYDVVEVDGVNTPGIVTITGHDRVQRVDVKSADGSGGASVTHKGEEPAQFTTTFTLCKDLDSGVDEFIEWEVFRAQLRGYEDGTRAANLYHPDLATNLITQATVKKIGGMKHDGKGGATVSVDWVEFKPPRPKTKNPKAGGKKKPDPNQDAKDEVDRLINEAKQP